MNDVYLNLQLRKSLGKQDKNGNYYFEVEASNENLDLQNQIVLQRALLQSKDNFLKHGIISYDHLYKSKDSEGRTVSDSHYIIGEPVDVYTEGKKTIVKGILYKSNDLAKDIIAKLKDGSKRIRASVGGLWPKIKKDANTGVEKIYEVLWNDLALTPTPVNNTVGSASLCKSMNPDEFFKALTTGGYGTDSSTFKNGRALQKEDVEGNITEIPNTIKSEVIQAIKDGIVANNEKEIRAYLENENIKATKDMIQEILKEGGNSMKKSTLSDEVDEILKSLEEDDKKETTPDEEVDDFSLEVDLDNEDDDDEEKDDEDDDDTMEKGKCKKSLDDDDYVDATDLIKSLRDVIGEQAEQLSELKKGLEDVGNAVVKIAKLTKSIGSTPEAPKSVLNKSVNTNAKAKSDRPTMEDFKMVQTILNKACDANEITLLQSTKMESEVQRCMQLGTAMSKETYNFISSRM